MCVCVCVCVCTHTHTHTHQCRGSEFPSINNKWQTLKHKHVIRLTGIVTFVRPHFVLSNVYTYSVTGCNSRIASCFWLHRVSRASVTRELALKVQQSNTKACTVWPELHTDNNFLCIVDSISRSQFEMFRRYQPILARPLKKASGQHVMNAIS